MGNREQKMGDNGDFCMWTDGVRDLEWMEYTRWKATANSKVLESAAKHRGHMTAC